jgi:hypothetical protein
LSGALHACVDSRRQDAGVVDAEPVMLTVAQTQVAGTSKKDEDWADRAVAAFEKAEGCLQEGVKHAAAHNSHGSQVCRHDLLMILQQQEPVVARCQSGVEAPYSVVAHAADDSQHASYMAVFSCAMLLFQPVGSAPCCDAQCGNMLNDK